MIYLILAMVSSMLVAVFMRLSEKYSRGGTGMLAVNYVMCCALSLAFSGSINLFPASEELPSALMLGGINGVLYLAGFVLLQWNISKNGVVLPSTFMKLGVLVPTVISMIVFGEQPGAAQIIGILMAVAAIILINGGEKQKTGSAPGLVLLLLAGGSGDVMSKVYEEIGPAALKDQFLLYTFMTALILCAALCIAKKQSFGWKEALFGLLVGIPNYFSARFLLLSLKDVPAVVAYPSFSVGTIVLVTVVGVLCFKEKLSRRKMIALGVILVSLALLNL
ncbi:MAG: DMT family transporter [Clostridia bacterium]|nr:DMT family transporter [Clostridia bacterium]